MIELLITRYMFPKYSTAINRVCFVDILVICRQFLWFSIQYTNYHIIYLQG